MYINVYECIYSIYILYIHPHVFPPNLIKGFQHISCMLLNFVLIQPYLTFQDGLTKTRTAGKLCGLKRLEGLQGGAKIL